MSKIIVIGSGFSGLSAAIDLSFQGYEVEVLEKHGMAGGRARYFETDGFRFEMGPSWYWMPDVFDRFFESYGRRTSDFYALNRLDPSYRVFFRNEHLDIPAEMSGIERMFEEKEPGSAQKLKKFLKGAQRKYDLGIKDLVFRPGLKLSELMDLRLIAGSFELDVLKSMRRHVNQYFKDPNLRLLLEFPVLFLGAPASRTPALYSLMNYADMQLGTWYPEGGMYSVVQAMVQLAEDQGVRFHYNTDVHKLEIKGGRVHNVHTSKGSYEADVVVSSADYRFTDQVLLEPKHRNYSHEYWEKRKMSPSVLLYFLGLKEEVQGLLHHNLFFDKDIDRHSDEIYDRPGWPQEPLFYCCVPSKTDRSLAPAGKENMFLLIPLAPGLEDSDQMREEQFGKMMKRIQERTGKDLTDLIEYKRSYAMSDLEKDYNAFKGNAYGLANTLNQTANLRPSIKNKKVNNLYYTGQLTVPGPGVPPSLISGQVVSGQIQKEHKIHEPAL
jgi:phytoene desaturase